MKKRDYIGAAAAATYILLPAALGTVCLVLFGLTRGGIVLATMSAAATLLAAFNVRDLYKD